MSDNIKWGSSQKGDYLLLRKVHRRLQGGHVVRFHTRPEVGEGQNVASHTWRALIVLTTLWEDVSKEAILWLLFHDVAEAELGDLPATTKWKYTELAQEFSKAEFKYEKDLELPVMLQDLTEKDRNLVKMADMLELVLHCKRQIQMGNTLAEPIYTRGREYLYRKFSSNPDFAVVHSILLELK